MLRWYKMLNRTLYTAKLDKEHKNIHSRRAIYIINDGQTSTKVIKAYDL